MFKAVIKITDIVFLCPCEPSLSPHLYLILTCVDSVAERASVLAI